MGTVVPKFSLVADTLNWYNASGRFKAWGTYTPKPGDLVIYNWSYTHASPSVANNAWGSEHIGIVIACDPVNHIFETVEGNTGTGQGKVVYYSVANGNNRWNEWGCVVGFCVN